MDPDDDGAAWHQHELECQQLAEQLASDPGYLEWLDYIEQQRTENDYGTERI